MKKETKPVQFYVDQELEGRFREVCMKMCINRSQFFRQRMQEFVDANGAAAGRGPFPNITASTLRNGSSGMFNWSTESGGVLTVAAVFGTGACFYQAKPFSTNGAVRKLIPKFAMKPHTSLFLTALINKESFKYNYGRAFSQSRIKNTVISLPVKENGEPDWEFMENYIKTLEYSGSI